MFATRVTRINIAIGVLLSMLVTASGALALEATAQRPKGPGGVRLDFCAQWARNCGQTAADMYCRRNGYEKAVRFQGEPARPTRVLGGCGSKRICDMPGCTGFQFITCSTSKSEPGPTRDWPVTHCD